MLYTLGMIRLRIFVPILMVLSSLGFAQTSESFPALEQWKAAVVRGDAVALKALYSVQPPAQVGAPSGKVDADADVAFWTGLKARSVAINVAESAAPQPSVQAFTLQLKVTAAGGGTTNFIVSEVWQDQGGTWRLVGERREVAKLEQPASVKESIYPTGDAREELSNAVARATKEHKNVLLVFGADWCYDCHVLEKAFERKDIAAVLNPNYEVVRVDIGEENKNLDLVQQYEVPLNRGIPAIAVLDSSGKLLYSQKNGEWEHARGLGPNDLLALLNQWKPQAK